MSIPKIIFANSFILNKTLFPKTFAKEDYLKLESQIKSLENAFKPCEKKILEAISTTCKASWIEKDINVYCINSFGKAIAPPSLSNPLILKLDSKLESKFGVKFEDFFVYLLTHELTHRFLSFASEFNDKRNEFGNVEFKGLSEEEIVFLVCRIVFSELFSNTKIQFVEKVYATKTKQAFSKLEKTNAEKFFERLGGE